MSERDDTNDSVSYTTGLLGKTSLKYLLLIKFVLEKIKETKSERKKIRRRIMNEKHFNFLWT